MRLAFIRQRYNPHGGAERFVERATAALAAQGVAMTVVAREWPDVAGTAGAAFMRCDPPYVGRLWRDLGFARGVCRLVERERFDLVQSHERLGCCDVYRAGDGVHARWLEHRARAQHPFSLLLTNLSPWHRYVVAAERQLYTSARVRAVICNSEMVRADVLRHYPVDPTKLHVIYNGVDLEHFHPRIRSELRARTRAELRLPEGERVYLFVGAGFERKGVDRLLRAFARLEVAEARVIIVGDDAALPRSRKLAQKLGIAPRVTFAGGRDDVRPYYAAADVFVLPTLYDPFPNAAIEAFACGLPVVTTFQCGAAELVRAGHNGAVCDALDEGALARVMLEVAQLDPATVAENARASVSHLGIHVMADRLRVLYETLLERNPPASCAKAR